MVRYISIVVAVIGRPKYVPDTNNRVPSATTLDITGGLAKFVRL
jgi:hypothetical protein